MLDAVGRTQATIDALGYRSSVSYDAPGQRIDTTNARRYKTTSVYDPVGRIRSTVDVLG